MANMRSFGKHRGYVSNLAKLFNETIVNGFITLPKFASSLLSTLRMMSPGDNLLNINDNLMVFTVAGILVFVIISWFTIPLTIN